MVNRSYDVIVVGAGAAGLIAAGRAAEIGARVLLIEKMRISGKKIRITGKGRCNLTNTADIGTFIDHFGDNGRFLRQSFYAFTNVDLINFFAGIGLDTITERGGRVFPASENAKDVVDTLERWCHKNRVTILHNIRVVKLIYSKEGVQGLTASPIMTDGGSDPTIGKEIIFHASKVILATGGASYPATGSTGDGYLLAQQTGHTIVRMRPALTPLVTAGNSAARLQGLSLKNVTIHVFIDDKKRFDMFGEMLFTHFGLSGPIILSASRTIVDALQENHRVAIAIDLKPALDEKMLDARLLRDLENQGNRKFKTILKGLLPNTLIPVCLEGTGIDADKPGHQISAVERKRLKLWLKDFRFTVIDYGKFDEAIITAGGVTTKEIDPRSMQSRLMPGLYFAGEIIDIDADTGGYNLQAAFSTGWVAGTHAASSLVQKSE